jgi:hypothetical protein
VWPVVALLDWLPAVVPEPEPLVGCPASPVPAGLLLLEQ